MIIDFHTHVFPKDFRQKGSAIFTGEPGFKSIYHSPNAEVVGVRVLMEKMDEAGVHKSVIFGFPWEKRSHFKRHNDYVIEAVQKHPDRLIGFCSFSPLAPDGAREVERCLQDGLSGVGELAVYGKSLSSNVVAGLKEVMAVCRQFDVPFLLHANEPVGHQYPGKAPMTLRQIYRFIKTYPSNPIVLAHWGGGLPFFALMKKEVRAALNNVWFDTAASPFLYATDIYRIAGQIAGFHKILFGSDYPLIRPQRYFQELADSGISSEEMAQIKGLNAKALLRI